MPQGKCGIGPARFLMEKENEEHDHDTEKFKVTLPTVECYDVIAGLEKTSSCHYRLL